MAAEDFENRQQLRTEELEAVEKATEILKSGSVTGMADKHLPGFLQTSLVLRGSKVRSEVNSELNFPSNFEGLVLGCIDADFCK